MSGRRGKRKQQQGHYDIPADLEASSAAPVFLREATKMGAGRVKQSVKSTPAVPSAGPSAPSAPNHDELRTEDLPSSRLPGQVFDLYEQEEDDAVYMDDADEPRELRDSDYPLREWVREGRDDYLEEVLYAEGRGPHSEYTACPRCSEAKPEYRCRSCMSGGRMLCKECMVVTHRQNPLHPIQVWTGSWFEKTTLKKMGLRIQLGHWHQRERRCTLPVRAAGDDFVIVDGDAVHEVGLDFCGCGGGSHTKQLLRAQLFPATVQQPRTAATFSVLRQYHLLSFESKCSTYEFYHSLARATDNTGLDPTKDRYHEFWRMTRMWRNLQMAKRAARGHVVSGIARTAAGECALLCPACPQPGKNLPPNWRDAPEEMRFLYALFLAIDANFRLKRKDVSSEEADPGLGSGWSFFCQVEAYMSHLADNWDNEQERSTCVAHDAVDKPDREARGTASSGIGAVDCARHNMKRPNAVGDLQLGERYINMDYMFFHSLANSAVDRLFVSYDIACQWHKNIWVRMAKYRSDLHFVGERKYMTFLVPKWHLPAHIEACNLQYSFNLTPDVGNTDGEAPERGWADANPLATSTKEMGPGARRDALDDHFNDVNHKKIIALGRTMLKKVKHTVPMMVEMKAALAHMEATLSPEALGVEEGPIPTWTAMAELWEKKPSEPNPFEMLRKDEHLAKVRHDLAVEAAAREKAGKEDADAFRDDMHITEMISMGLQLEEQQRVLRFDARAVGLHPTDDQSRGMVERTTKLRRKIISWIDIQRGFFPVVDILRAREDAARARAARTQARPGLQAYEIKLWMPSAIAVQAGMKSLMQVPLMRDAQDHEYRLRVGQGNESLDEIRRQLLVRTHLYKDKDAWVRGVYQNTRSNDKIELCDERIRRMTSQYRDARVALVRLGRVLEKSEWERTLQPLLDEDVRGMPRATFGDPDRQKATAPRRRKTKKARVEKPPTTVSWIWIAQAQQLKPGETAAMNEALRIEWAKARARAHRWREEVDLLEEEMRRILQFFAWRSAWWMERVEDRGLAAGAQREGETAYALRQAKLQADLGAHFSKMWADLPELIKKGRDPQAVAAGEAVSARAGAHEDGESDGEWSEDEIDEAAYAVPSASIQAANPLYIDSLE
ncbi:hypothetical protein DFH06DRAFT_1325031 [Mycena polygramma]|nr:hypothetical protein DFH06DRAFT_1325031 [Mycena polygramma]